MTMVISPARAEHLQTVMTMRDEASEWLAERGIDQWQTPWPNHDAMAERVAASIIAGETWVVHDGGQIAATLALDHDAHTGLWTPNECAEPARYLHRLIVRRSHAGLGAVLIDWAEYRAASEQAQWLRIDVWADNAALQAYYRRHGFEYLRTSDLTGYPSGALFQRPINPRAQHPAGLRTQTRAPAASEGIADARQQRRLDDNPSPALPNLAL